MALYQRGEIWYYCGMINGQYIDRSLRTRVKREALKKAQELERQIEEGGETSPSPNEALELFEKELLRLGRNPRYVDMTISTLTMFLEYAEKQTLDQFKLKNITDFLDYRHELGKAPLTINLDSRKIRQFFLYCVRHHWISQSPAQHIRFSKGKQVRPKRAFTEQEWQQFFASVSRRSSERARAYKILLLGGLRKKEGQLLERQDFTLGEKNLWHLRAEITKSKRVDWNPMLEEAEEVMREFKDLTPRDRLLQSKLDDDTFIRDLRRASIPRKLDGRFLSLHSLRYTFCSFLARKKVPIQTVKRLMRHASIKLTCDLYMDLGLEDIESDITGIRLGV